MIRTSINTTMPEPELNQENVENESNRFTADDYFERNIVRNELFIDL